MFPRNSSKPKYRPSFEALECKQLLSATVLTHGAHALVQTTVPVSSQVQHLGVTPDGTGKGIVIITT
jgi:hypothetical protein